MAIHLLVVWVLAAAFFRAAVRRIAFLFAGILSRILRRCIMTAGFAFTQGEASLDCKARDERGNNHGQQYSTAESLVQYHWMSSGGINFRLLFVYQGYRWAIDGRRFARKQNDRADEAIFTPRSEEGCGRRLVIAVQWIDREECKM